MNATIYIDLIPLVMSDLLSMLNMWEINFKAFKLLPDALKTRKLLYEGSFKVLADWLIDMLQQRWNVLYKPAK